MSTRHLIALSAAVSALAAPSAASAADPESGKVDAAAPKTEWSGTLVRPYPYQNIFYYEDVAGQTGAFPCEQPGCDTFTLDVKSGGADLSITVVSEQTNDMSMRIKDPAGDWLYVNGWNDAAKPTTTKYKKAADGTYVVQVIARIFGTATPDRVDDTADYKGTAALAVPPAPVTAPVQPPVTAPPQTSPPASNEGSAKKRKLAACRKKAKKIKNAKKRRAASKRCAKKYRG